MVAADDAVARTGIAIFGGLKGSVIGSCKAPVCRYSIERCVAQVAGNNGPQLVQFVFRRFVAELRYWPATASRSRCSPFTNCRLPFSTVVKKWSPSATFFGIHPRSSWSHSLPGPGAFPLFVERAPGRSSPRFQ